MEAFCKAISAIITLYLASGLPNTLQMLGTPGLPRYAAIAYLLCFTLGLLGTLSLFKNHPRLARGLLLWAIGLPSLVYATHELTVAFPTYFHVPITFGGSYSSGEFYRFGVDLIPAALFLIVWVATQRLVASASTQRAMASESGEKNG